MKRIATGLVIALFAVPALAQDSDRVAEIMGYVEQRAFVETKAPFDVGDYPKTIQIQRMRFVLNPQNEELATNLIWMLGNVEYHTEELATAIKFRLQNPQNPDRGLPEAFIYQTLKAYARIPGIIEPDIERTPAPHGNTFRVLGHAYEKLGFYKDALRVWELAVRAHPEDDVFVMLRDRTRKKLGG
ncbi:MAG TPA: hypothetical protein VNI20_06050 [Fimbriimonadaceae bacterium]|nr:hypothetical protein [Fimbriimonadaceae bacterium]